MVTFTLQLGSISVATRSQLDVIWLFFSFATVVLWFFFGQGFLTGAFRLLIQKK